MKSENLFAKSFARVTGRALKLGTKRKQSDSENQRFSSHNSLEFNPYNFTRLIKEPDLLENKDYLDYSTYVNKQLIGSKEKEIRENVSQSSDILVSQESSRAPFGSKFLKKALLYQKNRKMHNMSVNSNYQKLDGSDSSKTAYGDLSNRVELSPIKPRLVESRIAEKKEFLNMSGGFQRIFTNDKSDQAIKIPIAGYGGHRVGYTSKNLFGKPFRKCSIESKRIQRFMS